MKPARVMLAGGKGTSYLACFEGVGDGHYCDRNPTSPNASLHVGLFSQEELRGVDDESQQALDAYFAARALERCA